MRYYDLNSLYDNYKQGGGINNPGFKSLPVNVQQNIINNMQVGGPIINSKPVPMVENRGTVDEKGQWNPDMEYIRNEAKKSGSKIIRTDAGVVLYFNDDYVLLNADQGEMLNEGNVRPATRKKPKPEKTYSLQLGGNAISIPEAVGKLQELYPDLQEEDINEIISSLQQQATDQMEDLDSDVYMGPYYTEQSESIKNNPYEMRMGGYMQQGGMMMNKETEDQDGSMALGQIRAMQERLAKLQQMIRPDANLEPWVASKITLADDYINTINDYMTYNPEQTGEEYGEEDYMMMSPQMSQEEMMMIQQDVPMEMEEMRLGGYTRYAEGGGIPQRYKNMGFTKVGAKRQSTRPGKKWMVLAKKGSDYKVVHGGYKGMKDFSQHHSEKRKDNFWNRMGGKNSSKATDPFSPLYWHKRFGTWKEGGKLYNTNSLSNVDNVDYIEDMKRGGNFNLAKARVLYRKGIHNFDQRNPYEHGGYMNDNLAFIEKNRMIRNRKP